MSEQKKPEAGEFWEWAGERLRIIGTRGDGRIVGENQAGGLEMSCHVFDMTHLPDCDSFDWQPETFPQWYVCGTDAGWGITAYVVRDTRNTYFCVEMNGETKESPDYTWDQELVTCGFWKQVTQAEAEARVNKPEPVEWPDDWVTQDRVEPRDGVDYVRWSNFKPDHWVLASGVWVGEKHGHVDKEDKGRLEVRCRRRDLPPMPRETPKRDYVRFWVNETPTSFHIARGESRTVWPGYSELKHDGTGFYVEDGK